MKKDVFKSHSPEVLLSLIIAVVFSNCANQNNYHYLYPINKIKKSIDLNNKNEIEKNIKNYFTFYKEIQYKNVLIKYYRIKKTRNIKSYDLIKITYDTNTYYKSEAYIQTNITYTNNDYFGLEWSTLGNCIECDGLFIFYSGNHLIDFGSFYGIEGPYGYYYDKINKQINEKKHYL